MRPLTIVHVGNFPFGLRPGFQHGVPIKLSNGLVRNGHLTLNFSDRDIARARNIFGSRKFGRRAVNVALRDFCKLHRPDVLILSHADMINAETISLIRADAPNLRVAQCNVDPLFEADNVRRIRSKISVVDVTFVSTAGEPLRSLAQESRHLGTGQFCFMPNPVDLSIERGLNHLRNDLPFDVFYACGNPAEPLRNICGSLWNMDNFIDHLKRNLPDARFLLGGVQGCPRLAGASYQAALESAAMGLNISRRADHFLYSSDRLAQLAGNGLVMIMERSVGYDTLFDENQMIFFSSIDELIERVQQLISMPQRRLAVAAAGRARYHELFNERTVAAYVLDVIMGRDAAGSYSFPTIVASL